VEPSKERTARILAALAAPVTPLEARRPPTPTVREGRRWRPFAIAVRVAVAAVVLVLVRSQFDLLGRLDEAYRRVEHMQRIGEFVTSPGVSVVPLWGTEAARGAHAKVAYEHATGRFMLFSSAMPAPPDGQRYQLWVISDRVRPASVSRSESSVGKLDAPPRGDAPFLFALSLEAASGETDEPTGSMVLMSGPIRYPR
jgi:anti-sigma-K factor RskA